MSEPTLEHPSLEASLDDLKVVFRVLSDHARKSADLVGNVFVDSLRRLLEAQAREEGVDLGDDAAWQAWLRTTDDMPTLPRDLLN